MIDVPPVLVDQGVRRPYFLGFDPSSVPSPCFVVDKAALGFNFRVLADVAEASGARLLAALKAFSCRPALQELLPQLSGVCASGLHEARLGREMGAREIHVFAPAYRESELRELLQFAHHILFNSLKQWFQYRDICLDAQSVRAKTSDAGLRFGIRINPEHSEGQVPLYDPCAPCSRLGTTRSQWDADLEEARSCGISESNLLWGISELHFHALCEQHVAPLSRTLAAVESRWSDVLSLRSIETFNWGGGHHITKPDYDRMKLGELIRENAKRYGVQIYLEPGEAIAIHSGVLVGEVLDIHHNECPQVILDVSATCHMPDTLEMPYQADVWGATNGEYDDGWVANLGGPSCLAGDVMGKYTFPTALQCGDRLVFDDMSHYTMVKTTTFNGIALPAIALFDSDDGSLEIIKQFGYDEFVSRLGG